VDTLGAGHVWRLTVLLLFSTAAAQPLLSAGLISSTDFLFRRSFCTTWRQNTCRTRWVPQPSRPKRVSPRSGLPSMMHPGFSCSLFVSHHHLGSWSSSDPGDHPIPQPPVSICLMDLPSYFPTSGIYLQHTHFPSRRHHQKFVFWLGKLLSAGLAGAGTPLARGFREDAVPLPPPLCR